MNTRVSRVWPEPMCAVGSRLGGSGDRLVLMLGNRRRLIATPNCTLTYASGSVSITRGPTWCGRRRVVSLALFGLLMRFDYLNSAEVALMVSCIVFAGNLG